MLLLGCASNFKCIIFMIILQGTSIVCSGENYYYLLHLSKRRNYIPLRISILLRVLTDIRDNAVNSVNLRVCRYGFYDELLIRSCAPGL